VKNAEKWRLFLSNLWCYLYDKGTCEADEDHIDTDEVSNSSVKSVSGGNVHRFLLFQIASAFTFLKYLRKNSEAERDKILTYIQDEIMAMIHLDNTFVKKVEMW